MDELEEHELDTWRSKSFFARHMILFQVIGKLIYIILILKHLSRESIEKLYNIS